MVKPPRTMQPESIVEWEKAGRASTKSFGQDSFHNYMARKIVLQREQFGLKLPPPPPPLPQQSSSELRGGDDSPGCLKSPNHKSLIKSKQKYSGGAPAATDDTGSHGTTPSSSFRVRFAPGSKLGAPEIPTTNQYRSRRSKRNKSSFPAGIRGDGAAAEMGSMLRRLKRRHGSSGFDAGEEEEKEVDFGEDVDAGYAKMKSVCDDECDSTFNESANRPLSSVISGEIGEVSNPNFLVKSIVRCESASVPDKVVDVGSGRSLKRPRCGDRPDLFFSGVVVMVNGDTNPDTDTLQRLLHRNGGDVEKYETSRVTHIIAEHLSFAKAKMYKNQRNPRPVVYPAWIVDSVAAQKVLPIVPYLLKEFRRDMETAQSSVKAFFQQPANSETNVTTGADKSYSPQNSNKLESTKDAQAESLCLSEHTETWQDTPPLDIEYTQIKGTTTSSSVIDEQFRRQNAFLKSMDCTVNLESSRSPHDDDIEHTEITSFSPFGLRISEQEHGERAMMSHLSLVKPKKLLSSLESDEPLFVLDERNASDDVVGKNEDECFGGEEEVVIDRNHDDEDMQNDASLCTNAKCHDSRTDEKYINGRIRTVGTDPDFLNSFFRNSRLSYIGSFKQRRTSRPDNRCKVASSGERFVFHIDMDCFFAAVVLRKFPQYRNQPVVISHHGKRNQTDDPTNSSFENSTSECATCNYEARKYGIKKGMYLGRAKALCSSLVVLSYDFEGYQEVSATVADIIHRVCLDYGGVVEEVSCDESYMEIYLDSKMQASEIAESMRMEILKETECTATIGVAANKFLAKLATDNVKPNRSFVVEDFRVLLRPLKLRDLHGIGYRSEPRLAENGFVTVQDVWNRGESGLDDLKNILGERLGRKIWLFCQGEDDRPVECADRKTIGAECNYGVRFNGPYGVDFMIRGLAKEVENRMESVGVKGSKVTLKVKRRKPNAPSPPKFLGHGSCFNLSKSLDAPRSTRDAVLLSKIGIQLFDLMNVPKEEVRGMGMVVSNLLSDDRDTSHGEIQKYFQKSSVAEELLRKDQRTAKGDNSKKYDQGIHQSNIELSRESEQDNFCDQDDSSVEIINMEPDDECDVALPALSQIHMSQVDALPYQLRRQIKQKMEKEKSCAPKRKTADESHAMSKQPSIKVAFSAVNVNQSHRSYRTTKALSKADHKTGPAHGIPVKLIFPAADTRDFYLENILPLSQFLDGNPPCKTSEEKVVSFFDQIIEGTCFHDAVRLLRSIRQRGDAWRDRCEFILNVVNAKVIDVAGAPLCLD